MLDAGYLINKKERLLVLSSISPRRRLYEPEARAGLNPEPRTDQFRYKIGLLFSHVLVDAIGRTGILKGLSLGGI